MSQLVLDELGAHARVQKIPSGGWRIPATLTRTGLFTYVEGGKVLSVLRPESEVFADASIASLAHAAITVFHPTERLVTEDNYRALNVGYVEGVKRQGARYVSGDLIVKDGVTGSLIDKGDLCEVSLGYRADYAKNPDGSFESGMFEGRPYDRKQINIRYNHVALGPRGWGRAGSDVGVKLDGDYIVGMENVSAIFNDEADPKASAATQVIVDMSQFVPKGEHDKLQAKCDALESQVASLTADNKVKTDAASPAALDALVAVRAALFADAQTLAGKDFKCDGKTDMEIMSAALLAADPAIKLDGKSHDYVRASFDLRTATRKSVAQSAQVAVDVAITPSASNVVTDSVATAAANAAKHTASAYEEANKQFSVGSR